MENKVLDHPGNIVYHTCLNCVHCVPALPLIGPSRPICDILDMPIGAGPKPYNKCILFKLSTKNDN